MANSLRMQGDFFFNMEQIQFYLRQNLGSFLTKYLFACEIAEV